MKFLTAFFPLSVARKRAVPLAPHAKVALLAMAGLQLSELKRELMYISRSKYNINLNHTNIVRVYANWLQNQSIKKDSKAMQNAVDELLTWAKNPKHFNLENKRAVAYARSHDMKHHIRGRIIERPIPHLILFLKSFEKDA